jgi:hypothetical protein
MIMAWTFLGEIKYDEYRNKYGLYRCSCGVERFNRVSMVNKPRGTFSCGCLRAQKSKERMLGEVGIKARTRSRATWIAKLENKQKINLNKHDQEQLDWIVLQNKRKEQREALKKARQHV